MITNARVATAAAAKRMSEARRVESDLPGVTYLELSIRTNLGPARVEVYSARKEFGSASVIIGGVGTLIVPTDEMTAAFTAHGCVDMHDAA